MPQGYFAGRGGEGDITKNIFILVGNIHTVIWRANADDSNQLAFCLNLYWTIYRPDRNPTVPIMDQY